MNLQAERRINLLFERRADLAKLCAKCVAVAVLAACLLSLIACADAKPEPELESEDSSETPAALEVSETSLSEDEAAKAGLAAKKKSAEMARAERDVEQLVSGYGDSVAVAVVPLDGSEGFSINGDKQFVSASMIKLLVLAEYVNEVDAGTLDPSAQRQIGSIRIVGGTGQIQNERASSYSYETLARYMIKFSDNTATNVLIDAMGFDNINGRATALGLSGTNLQRKMMDLNSGVENHISADDAAALLAGIANGTIASPGQCEAVKQFLLEQTDNDGLMQGLPSGVSFAHKTGSLDRVRHDGGIVYADKPYVVVVLTELEAAEANALMSSVSSAVYDNLE